MRVIEVELTVNHLGFYTPPTSNCKWKEIVKALEVEDRLSEPQDAGRQGSVEGSNASVG